MSEHTCLVCGYSGDLEFYPSDNRICGCCGTEFGYDDRILSRRELRTLWIRSGFPWFDENEPRPEHWDPIQQLKDAGFASELLRVFAPAPAQSSGGQPQGVATVEIARRRKPLAFSVDTGTTA